ncbi:MAG: nitrilase-related carbon-nitrogen hydrolase, partial [Cyanobacteria bacterium P01_H01_bin.130]
EHYNPLARYSLMAGHEQIHCAQFPGSMVGSIFGDQTEVTMRHHALESGCFVVCATGWLTPDQVEAIAPNEGMQKVLRGGCYTSIISPEGVHLCEPIREGEGIAIADLDFSLITKRKRMMDSVGHYARPDLLQLGLNTAPYSPTAPLNAADSAPTGTPNAIAPGKDMGEDIGTVPPFPMPSPTTQISDSSDSSLQTYA